MNKILGTICLLTVFSASSQPLLEITEFGKKSPSVRIKIAGKNQEISGENWNCSIEKKSGKVNLRTLKFQSSLHEPLRLAVKYTLPLDFKPLRFWDGHKEHQVQKLPLERTDFLEAFPLAVADNGKKGTALGFAPENILSGFCRSLTEKSLILETRIVVDDRRVQTLVITEFDFKPEFGWRNAVEDYQNAFPSYFRSMKGVDRRIYGVGGYLSGAHKQRAFQLHSARFSGINWEWTYAPWYESGNWYPVGAGWQKEKNEFRNYAKIRSNAMLTREEYDNALKTQIQYGNKSAAMFYYILVKDIHQNVAKSYHLAVQGNSGLHSLPSNRGKTKSAFAPGSLLFDYLKEQLKQVVDNYEVSGFSFDMANSSYHFTTPSQLEYAVGRSWYDDGRIYTSDTVAPIPFADYIHTLKRNGKPMGTIFNAALSKFSPFTMFRCDAAIMEGPPQYNYSIVLPLRLIMGRKPFSFWHFTPAVSDGIKTGFLANDPVGKARVNLGLKQFYLLKCYELGANPMNWETIDGFWKNHLPVLRVLSEAGYHPVSAVKDSGTFWVGRFGDGCRTLLTVSNPGKEKVTRTLRVVNSYLGKDKYVFFPQQGKLRQKISNGETVFKLTLAPKEVIVLRTVAVKGNISEFTASAENLNLTFIADKPFTFELPSEDCYGRRIPGDKNGIFSGRADKSKKLVMLPACGIFADSESMVAMLNKETVPEIEAGKAPEIQTAAEMVAMYRSHVKASMLYCGKINNREPGFMRADLCKADLKITVPGVGQGGKRICVGTLADFPGFKVPENFAGAFLAMPDSHTLWIGGRTPAEVRKAADMYFSILDKSQLSVVKVDFKNPAGWGGNEKFVAGKGQKYLQITGNPEKKNNNWRYQWHPVAGAKGGDEVAFTVSCKLEKLSSGKVQLGVYEFADEKGRKSLRFSSVEVKAGFSWQTISGKVKLHKNTRMARFYFLCRNLGKSDVFQVRSLELSTITK
ncbi:MAG: hypothetical protein E7044_01340 [Lentisphaerae bacterium]|nr:hypothetical protein [Lentisphaerota bacterium]